MTRKLYLASPTLAGTVTVTHVGDDGRPFVRLSETLFHPQGGGQKADRGTVAGRAVIHVAHADGGEVSHYLDSTAGLSVGDAVELTVDPEWRHLNARWHTAGHLLAAVAERLVPGLEAVAGHHWPGEGRVEFTPADGAATELMAMLPPAIAEAVAANLPVTVVGDPLTNRAVVVGNGRPVPCGGTHLPSVGGVGAVTITGVKAKGGKLRVSYSL